MLGNPIISLQVATFSVPEMGQNTQKVATFLSSCRTSNSVQSQGFVSLVLTCCSGRKPPCSHHSVLSSLMPLRDIGSSARKRNQ
jgi:hypothetical protein